MSRRIALSAQTLAVLAALAARPSDWRHGYDLARETGLKSGTLYPILVRLADREIVEEWKWMGSPVWSRDGIIAVANAHKDKVKVTFAYGASLADPDKLFNASLEGNARRAIDYLEGDKVDARALTALVRTAIARNQAKHASKKTAKPKPKPKKATRG